MAYDVPHTRAPFTNTNLLHSQDGQMIAPIIKCRMKSFIQFQATMVQPLKIGHGYVISYHTFMTMWSLVRVSKSAPSVIFERQSHFKQLSVHLQTFPPSLSSVYNPIVVVTSLFTTSSLTMVITCAILDTSQWRVITMVTRALLDMYISQSSCVPVTHHRAVGPFIFYCTVNPQCDIYE